MSNPVNGTIALLLPCTGSTAIFRRHRIQNNSNCCPVLNSFRHQCYPLWRGECELYACQGRRITSDLREETMGKRHRGPLHYRRADNPLCKFLRFKRNCYMLGSSAILLITVAVNVAHLRLYKKTGARPSILLLTVIASLTFFGILVYYEIGHSPAALYGLIVTLILCFIGEWVYRGYSHRTIKTRK